MVNGILKTCFNSKRQWCSWLYTVAIRLYVICSYNKMIILYNLKQSDDDSIIASNIKIVLVQR